MGKKAMQPQIISHHELFSKLWNFLPMDFIMEFFVSILIFFIIPSPLLSSLTSNPLLFYRTQDLLTPRFCPWSFFCIMCSVCSSFNQLIQLDYSQICNYTWVTSVTQLQMLTSNFLLNYYPDSPNSINQWYLNTTSKPF